ncbi:hypothetical protein ACGRHY_23395 [Streptomyces sp. HK10]|uniref:hypothetical protein n=1 Tax=Streptomyces sp. HK10 TaxID=3373255 RepID=UPI003748B763
MDPEIAALAGSAGTTVLTLMVTDAWERARDGVVSLWRRVHPDRADAVGAELEATRSDLLAAAEAGDVRPREELHSEWQGRIRRLLAADPRIAEDLRRLLEEIGPADGQEPAPAARIRMQARASGHGRVYQAGRDQHITEK